MKRTPAPLALSVLLACAPVAAQQNPAGTPSTLQTALYAEVIAYLENSLGGENGLFRKITGTDKRVNQTLTVSIPDSALALGKLHYGEGLQLSVVGVADSVASCDKKPKTLISQQQHLMPPSGTWSVVAGHDESVEHVLRIDPKAHAEQGLLAQDFSFESSVPRKQSAGVMSQAVASALAPDKLALDGPMQSPPFTAVVYRKQAVVMRGHQVPFTATAMVDSLAPLTFTVTTHGGDFHFLEGERRVFALSNVPANGATSSDREVSMDGLVLSSPDGAYIFSKEGGTNIFGAYSVVSTLKSKRTYTSPPSFPTVARIWTPYNGPCGARKFAITQSGNLVFNCDGQLVWQSDTGSTSSKHKTPCRYLTFGAQGELVCYSQDISRLNASEAAQFMAWSSQHRDSSPIKASDPTVNTYQLTLNQLTGESSHNLVFNGSFNGERIVSDVVSCQDPPIELKAKGCTGQIKVRQQLCPAITSFLVAFPKQASAAASSESQVGSAQ